MSPQGCSDPAALLRSRSPSLDPAAARASYLEGNRGCILAAGIADALVMNMDSGSADATVTVAGGTAGEPVPSQCSQTLRP